MSNAQAVRRKIKRAEQNVQGTPQTTGSQLMRRKPGASFDKNSDTYENDEIVDHQQSTGQNEGTYSTVGKLPCYLSPGSYAVEFKNLLRQAWAATPAITGLSITIAAAGQAWTITRASGSFLTDGIKQFDMVRLTAGSFNAANINKNLNVLSVTASSLTVIPQNGVTLVAEGTAVTGATLSVPGKKCWVPTTGHLDGFLTYEDWNPDVPSSAVFPDVKVGAAAITVPASGNPEVSWDFMGLSRALGTSEVLTSPNAATTTPVLADAQGKVMVNGVVTPVTSVTANITGNIQPGDPEVGSQARSGHKVGKVAASGTLTAKFSQTTLMALRDNQTVIPLAVAIAVDNSAASDFVVIVFPAVKIFTDSGDDGAEIIKTYNWVAQIPATGGASLANWQTIVSIQDSQAP